MSAALAGFLTGLSLIVAIGAQNAFVLRLGLTRQHIGVAVAICASSDVVLIILGIGGIGRAAHAAHGVLTLLKWVGVAYLAGYAVHAFWRATRREVLVPSTLAVPSVRAIAAKTLAFTFLNPHVYLDTVLLLGTVGNQYGGSRWSFATGACLASILWFCGLGYGARSLAPLMARPATWRVLDSAIGVVMVLVAVNIARTHITA